MPKPIFKTLPAQQNSFFPMDIFSRIPENHPVRLVNQVVEELDISVLLEQYKGGGTTAYHPKMMLKVLFYSYFSTIYSCRKIAKALNENIHFMFIAGNSTPDFRTINDFRGKILKEHINTLFTEVVKMLMEMGYVTLDVQYIDGTKIESSANRYTFKWKKSIEKYKVKLEEKIKSVLSDIENHIQADNQELNQEELPQKINSQDIKEKLAELNKKLKEPSKQQLKALKKLEEEHLPKLETYEKDLEILGKRNSYSKTDPDATFMRMKDDHMGNGQLKPAYNAQISSENQFITLASIHQKPGDTTTLAPHLDKFEENYQKQSEEVVADAGYGSEENYEMLEEKEITAYVKYNYFHKEQKKKFKENPFAVANLFYNQEKDFYVCPMGQKMTPIGQEKRVSENGYESQVTHYQAERCEGCPLRGQCHQAKTDRIIAVNHRLNELRQQAKTLLMSEKGIEHRKKRPIEVEAVFGQMKSNNHFNRFTLRGLEKVALEFSLMAMGHNLRKLAAKAKKKMDDLDKTGIKLSLLEAMKYNSSKKATKVSKQPSHTTKNGGKCAKNDNTMSSVFSFFKRSHFAYFQNLFFQKTGNITFN